MGKNNEKDELKQFVCKQPGCDKKYARYPSLYTHQKLKHPDMPIQSIIPTKNPVKQEQKIKKGSNPIAIREDLVNLLCNANFLMFFKEIKELNVFDDNLKEYFLPESSNFTKLDLDLIKKGKPNLLENVKAIIEEAMRNRQNMENSIISASGFIKQSSNYRFNDSVLESTTIFVPKHYVGFFVIAKELVKPLSEQFALEICYFFDKIILESAKLQGQTYRMFISVIQEYLNDLINANLDSFKKLGEFNEEIRKKFCNKFAYNLGQLFQLK